MTHSMDSAGSLGGAHFLHFILKSPSIGVVLHNKMHSIDSTLSSQLRTRDAV